MNIPSKKIIIPMAAVAIFSAGAYGVTQVSAASDSANPQTSLVQKIADTFHLDKTKVQAVFDQNRQDNQANHETNYEARLTQAVTDGKLTSAQKDLVLAEHKKLQGEMDAAMSDDTSTSKTDRRTAMQKIRSETRDWAKANHIDAKWLIGPGRIRGGHRGPGGGMPGGADSPADTQS
ncbi:MAG TPA: hypothetical protein VMT30_05355 [Candidatus Saccharimonadia bacterium]|nr:hypothetical protein [Candidatus Saccharimonadia bacterium]